MQPPFSINSLKDESFPLKACFHNEKNGWKKGLLYMGTFYIEDVTVASNIPSKYMKQKKPGEFHENYRIAILPK